MIATFFCRKPKNKILLLQILNSKMTFISNNIKLYFENTAKRKIKFRIMLER